MLISERLGTRSVSVNLRGATVEEVISELADLIASDNDGTNPEVLRDCLLERERVLSTAMGAGIAFPHCTIPYLANPKFALGVSHRGIDADAPDNKPVHIFFVVISPERDPNAHLDSLAAASRVFMNSGVRDKVLVASTAEEIIAAIAEGERG